MGKDLRCFIQLSLIMFCPPKTADYPVAAWTLVGLFSLVTLVKEILHMLALGWNYFNLERITRILFVKLVLLLCFLLMIGKEDAVASLSVVSSFVMDLRNHVT